MRPLAARTSVETIRAIHAAIPGSQTIISLSGVSYGLPARRALNRAYLPMLLEAGVDAIILDPLDRQLMSILRATQVLLGQDPSGIEYIKACRLGQLG